MIVEDEQRLLQQESILKEWRENDDEISKIINKLFSSSFKMKDGNEIRKYNHLPKVQHLLIINAENKEPNLDPRNCVVIIIVN